MDNIYFVVNGKIIKSAQILFQDGQTLSQLITAINKKVLDIKNSENLDNALVMYTLISDGLGIPREINMLNLDPDTQLNVVENESPIFQVTMMVMPGIGGSRRKRKSRKSKRSRR